jgi:DNA-binding transcriptional ArsR family regulator
MRRDVFQAIADPTRREIIGLLAKKTMNLNSVAEKFDISRPAISKHIKILTECGLVKIRQDGRERYCEARLQQLNEVTNWVEQYRHYWDKKFDALDQYLNTIQHKRKSHGKK